MKHIEMEEDKVEKLVLEEEEQRQTGAKKKTGGKAGRMRVKGGQIAPMQ